MTNCRRTQEYCFHEPFAFCRGPFYVALFVLHAAAQEKVIRLYDGPAPGSEDWKQTEQENRNQSLANAHCLQRGQSDADRFPTEAGNANGTALVICPGGAFFALSIDSEGFDVARWLNAKGVTCFVLKYRLVECKTDDPTREVGTRGPSG